MNRSAKPVYIIDDDASLCKALSRLVRSIGYRPTAFTKGEDFLALSEIEADAWVICDLYMPGADGLEVFRRTRRRHFDVPFIFITGFSDNGRVEEAKRLGSAFFRKPVHEDDLIRVLSGSPGKGLNAAPRT